ncbi:MAG: DUF4350 domain-containing protein [Ilumatobacteraceae bacterium]
MSQRSAAAARRSGGGGRAAMTALVVVAVAVAMLLLVRSRPQVEAFDPRSSAGNGANGALLLLEDYGASVDISASAPRAGTDTRVLVIADRLNDDQRNDLLAFVAVGGVAVVADPTSSLHGGASEDDGAEPISASAPGGFGTDNQLPASDEANVDRGNCSIGALDALRGVFSPKGLLFPVADDQPHCFSSGDVAFAIVRSVGDGYIVGLGDNNIVTNAYLRYADNAGVVTALLAPERGASVRIMIGTEAKPSVTDIGTGDETLVDLVSPRVWMALSQLALAFVVFCFARGIRPGRAVRESLPTPIAGNELVLATGNLMQRAHHQQRAAWLVRGEFYRQLVAHYRTPPDISVDRLTSLVANRSGVDPAELRAVLLAEIADHADSNFGGFVRSSGSSGGESLLNLSNQIERLRRRTIIDRPDFETPRQPTS